MACCHLPGDPIRSHGLCGLDRMRIEAPPRGGDLHTCADLLVEFDDVLIVHPDAAARDVLADGPRSVGPMNPVKGTPQVEGTDTERVAGMPARHGCRQTWVFPTHFGSRSPGRVHHFA